MSGSVMSSNENIRNSSAIDFLKRSVLQKLDHLELKLFKITIRRTKVSEPISDAPIERAIDDPANICSLVHKKQGYRTKPLFGSAIVVNQEFLDDVFHGDDVSTISKIHNESKSPVRSRERSRGRSRERSRERTYRSETRSRSRSVDYNRRHRSKSTQRKIVEREDKRKHLPGCPLYSGSPSDKRHRSVSPLKPGEYRRNHPVKTLRYKRSRSRSRHSRTESEKNIPSHSRDRSSGKSRKSRARSQSILRYDEKDRRTRSERYLKRKSRSKSRDYRSRSPRYRSRSPKYRSRSPHYKSRRDSRSPRRRSRSPHYKRVDEVPEEIVMDYYEGNWMGGRMAPMPNGYPMQRFYPPTFYPRGMMPMPMMPPGPMMVPRMPMMRPYGPYRQPMMGNYNRYKAPKQNTSTSTITSDKDSQSHVEIVKVDELDSSINSNQDIQNPESPKSDTRSVAFKDD
ncbi:hypothetical protein GWI33_008117 [Rhynchophorus ferrugineus]|uniref:Uncharacterized protein n=1 Tax=Rhynchophorus ferrugineus TaxID=354439 RepID=A0A834IRL3_RHYFE|nr:hypothetical protein GWI33_008117 [Rhynchophorus ferrugineus]